MSGLYQYGGTVTADREDEYLEQLEYLAQSTQRAWEASVAADAEAERLAAENARLLRTMQDIRRDKKRVQSKARRLSKSNIQLRQRVEELTPPDPSESDGRRRLLAAAEEAARYDRRKLQERKAA